MAPTATKFDASAPVAFAKGKLGLYFAWAAFSKRDGEDFYDSHGDHIPEDDLVAGALSLAKAGLLKVEHEGEAKGSVPMVMSLTTDIKDALGIEAANSGIVVGFEPDATTAAAIDSGEVTEMSISGRAMAELVKAAFEKSDDKGKAKRKRKLTQVEIDEVSLVKRAAHGSGTRIAIAKRAGAEESPADADGSLLEVIRKSEAQPLAPLVRGEVLEQRERTAIAKGAHPALTTATDGHSHLIYDVDCEGGSTSYESSNTEKAAGSYRSHSHPWVRTATGIVIGEADGHTHSIATESVPMTKSADTAPTADLEAATKRVSVLKTALLASLSAPADQRAYAARLTGDQAEAFFAKSEGERAAEVKDAVAYTAKSGAVFYKSDDPRLVDFAKRDDEREVELVKTREATELATFEKRAADELKHTKPTVRAKLLKAAEAIGPEAVEALKEGDAARAYMTKAHGVSGPAIPAGSALERYEAGLATFAKAAGKSADAVADDFLDTPEGKRLYADYETERTQALRH